METIDIKPNSVDSHQSSPYWIAYIVPFKIKNTYNYDIKDPGSSSEGKGDPVSEGEHILIDNDCTSWTISSSKSAHTSSLTMSLSANINYLAKINPSDWILFWVFDNKTDYDKVKTRLSNKDFSSKPALNHKSFGLKFIGRVDIVTSALSITQTGMKTFGYNLNAYAFSELDSNIYFDAQIMQVVGSATFNWYDFSKQESIKKNTNSIMPTQMCVPSLLIMMLGEGFGAKGKYGNQSGRADLGKLPSQTPNETYLIPDSIANILQKPLVEQQDSSSGRREQNFFAESILPTDTKSVKITSYAHLLEVFIGVHDYTGYVPQWEMDTFNDTGFFIRESPQKLNDPILVMPIQAQMVPLWGILEGYLNKPINEMYTCMRMGVGDNIYPTLMIRRLPFSTKSMASFGKQLRKTETDPPPPKEEPNERSKGKGKGKGDKKNQMATTDKQTSNKFADNFNTTLFLDLPRWKIDDGLITSISFTKSGIGRTNFALIQSSRPGIDSKWIRWNTEPVVDEADIKRSGLKGIIQQIQATFTGDTNAIVDARASFYNKFWMDVNAGNQFKLTGVIKSAGIQAPICEGDNCVVSGLLFHIERVVHSGSIAQNGIKNFMTQLELVNGILLEESEKSDQHVYYVEKHKNSNESGILDSNSKVPNGITIDREK
jgi:hypothetical protein